MDNYPGRVPQAPDEDTPVQNEQTAGNGAHANGTASPYHPQNGATPPYVPAPPQASGPYGQPPNGQPPYDAYANIPAPPPGYPYSDQAAQAQPASAPGNSRRQLIISGIIGLAIILGIAGFLAGGEFAQFMTIGIQFIPFVVLALLAYGGVKNKQVAVFAYICLLVIDGLMMLNVLTNVFVAVVTDFQKLQAWEINPRGTALSEVFRPDALQIIAATMLLLVIAFMLSLATLLRPVRVALARLMPFDPDSFVHKIALSVLTLLLLSSFIPLIVLSLQPPLLIAVSNPTLKAAGGDAAGLSVSPQQLIYQFVWMIPSTLVGAGWLIVRKYPDVLKRLGMVRPTLKQVGMGLVLGVVFAVLSGFLDQGIHWVFTSLGWATTNTGAFYSDLMAGVTNPLGAVLIGVVAGVSEEMAFRGLLQPRFGIIASNLVFTSLHAFQYGPDGLLSVFIIGLALGIIRSKTNTSTSAIVHGTYDFVSVIAVISGF